MFRFLLSKKGFTVTELFAVVIVMSVLVAIAVPLFGNAVKIQRQNECRNNRTIISTAFEQVMYGMIDNGKKQESVNFGDPRPPHLNVNYPAVPVKDEDEIGVADDDYVGDPCFVLCYDTQIAGKKPFTIGDIRGGYRDTKRFPDYQDGCDNGNYLKKKDLKDKPFYKILANEEIPVCPFADLTDVDKDNDYYYHILWDTATDSIKVLCSCPYCNEAD